jgi:phosphate transport system substrate-binding protein
MPLVPKITSRLLLLIALLLGVGCRPVEAGNNDTVGGAATIQNKGSDTLVNVALAWAEAYRVVRPDIAIVVTGGGTGTGIASLINGTVDIANASREIKDSEREEALANGIEAIQHVVARDAIAIVVHPSNPVSQLTLAQISAIYTGDITNWREVGGEDRPIVLLSRESNSGTHVYFLEEVVRLGNSDSGLLFSPETLLLPSSEGITVEVSQNPNAIGYDGLGYVTAEQKVVAVSQDEFNFVLPTAESVNSGAYPIARSLYMITAGQPQGVVKEYLDWIMSPAAQAIVAELGFVPLEPAP